MILLKSYLITRHQVVQHRFYFVYFVRHMYLIGKLHSCALLVGHGVLYLPV